MKQRSFSIKIAKKLSQKSIKSRNYLLFKASFQRNQLLESKFIESL
ncbi:DNA-binding protein [Enterococcus faecalis]|nr:DNA-binding protein [Enterococcus faecalis]PQE59691.1 DNA-binding protein [Enterococcus faecalis]PQE68658.1 DNA-binding protein [Enterococcus faecalis]PQE97547.1 DNA-binding protein [Enterococcus faecalis]PQF56344.1 DNA-binding protein [Enterococcus faecalis]